MVTQNKLRRKFMKKMFVGIFVMFLLTSCSHYQTKWNADPVKSPDSLTQLLRNRPLLEVAKNAVFFNKDNVEDLCKFLKSKENLKKYFDFEVVSNNTTLVSVQTKSIDNFLKNYNKIINGAIFLDIQYCQESSEIQNNINISNSNLVDNLDKRALLLSDLIKDELIINNFKVTNNVEEATYKMKIIVLEDGITSKNKTSLFYSYNKKTGIVGLNIKFINISNNNIDFAYQTKNRAYLIKNKILHFIPKYSSSENLKMEY